MPPFVPGRELCGAFYVEAVRPILGSLPHSACLWGPGSDVLGFDTERSTDHDWGPRLQLVVERPDPRLERALGERLPPRFRGWPTSRQRVHVAEPGALLHGLLGFDPRQAITLDDWLVTPSQVLRSVVEGAIYHDGLGVLGPVQDALRWYPRDVWLHVLACQWRRIAQEEHLMGRAAEAGDELGSRLLAARLAGDVVRLCFLMERRHAPYGKWLGTAFRRLGAASELEEPLLGVLCAADHAGRERALCTAYEAAGRRCNALGLTPAVDATVRRFYDRPFLVLDAGRFAGALRAEIRDPRVRARGWVGSVDQVVDTTDVLSSVPAARGLMGTHVGS